MKHSLLNRIIIGKTAGFLLGIIGVIALHQMNAMTELLFNIGLIFFYSTIGAIIGMMGLFTKHPIFKFPMPWWFRGAAIGLSMHVVLVLLCYEPFLLILQNINLFGMTSPWWMLIDGIILGIMIDFITTKLAGEGEIPIN